MAAAIRARRPTVAQQHSRQLVSSVFGFGLLILIFGFVMLLTVKFKPAFGAAFLILGLSVTLALFRPALGLGAAIVLTVVGDPVAMPWWPVDQNLSARQSVLYVADAATVKPLEMTLLVVVAALILNRRLSPGSPPLVFGSIWRAMLVFSAALVFGFAMGMGRGGDFRIAVFEVTPLAYIPMVYLAATNTFTTLQHYHRLLFGIVVAIALEAVHTWFGLAEFRQHVPKGVSPLTHTAALHTNLLLLLFVATLWFGTRRAGKRTFLLLLIVPTVVIVIDAQRRSGIVALIIGGLALTLVLFVRDRKTFYRTVPLIALVVAVYAAAFWNSTSPVAFPAQAVKTVIQPGEASAADASSDLYRVIETYDLNATIRSSPLLGIGFGKRFYQPIRLPDISLFFEFSRYIPHNSVLWVWMKLGFVGFVSYLYLIMIGTARGIRGAVRLGDPDDAALMAVITAYLPMSLVVAFVEISVDATTTMLLALALALSGSIDRLAEREGAYVEVAETSRSATPDHETRRLEPAVPDRIPELI